MKNLKGLFLIATTTSLLVACTDEKSSSPAPVVYGLSNIHAAAVPANAAPNNFTHQVISALSKLGVDQPTPLSIFSPTGNAEQQNQRLAKSLLSPRGQKALQDIQARCDVQDTGNNQSGIVQQSGQQTITRNRGINGRRCPVQIQSNYSAQFTFVTHTTTEQQTVADISANTSYEVRSVSHRDSLAVTALNIAYSGRNNDSLSGDRPQLKKAKDQFNNQLKITLSNGEVLSGPFFQEILEITENSFKRSKTIQYQEQHIADLSSSAGAVRLVYLIDEAQNPSRRAYVNGAEVSPYLLSGFFGDVKIAQQSRR